MTLIHLFPGQGAQRVGMGADLFPQFGHLMAQADDALGWSVAELCLDGPADRLADTRYTQPALYVVSALHYLQRVRETGRVPALLAGHSLGEYTALFAGGAFDFLTGLEIVAERGRLMAEAPPGAMSAVIGLSREHLDAVLRDTAETEAQVANLNLVDQIVLAGSPAGLDRIAPLMKEAGASVVTRLPVSGAFHSRWMAGPAEAFRSFLAARRFNRIRIPTLSDVTAQPHTDDRVHELLGRQMTEPVQWVRCMEYLTAQPDPEVHDVGPGEVLARLLARFRDAQNLRVG